MYKNYVDTGDGKICLHGFKDLCRAAALGEQSWDDVLREMCCVVDADKGFLAFSEPGKPYHISASYNHSQATIHANNYSKKIITASKLMFPGAASTLLRYSDGLSKEIAAQFRNFFFEAKVSDDLHSVVMDTKFTGRQIVCLQRCAGSVPFNRCEIDLMQDLIQYVREAMLYALKITWRGEGTETSTDFTGLIDRKLRLSHPNDDLISALKFGTAFSCSGNKLIAKTDYLKAVLALTIQKAVGGKASSFRLNIAESSDSKTKKCLKVKVTPRPQSIVWLPGSKDTVLIKTSLVDLRKTVDVTTFCYVFELTNAEKRTLEGLASARNTREAATITGVSYKTFRWHLKNIFSKTGFSSQEELRTALLDTDISNASL